MDFDHTDSDYNDVYDHNETLDYYYNDDRMLLRRSRRSGRTRRSTRRSCKIKCSGETSCNVNCSCVSCKKVVPYIVVFMTIFMILWCWGCYVGCKRSRLRRAETLRVRAMTSNVVQVQQTNKGESNSEQSDKGDKENEPENLSPNPYGQSAVQSPEQATVWDQQNSAIQNLQNGGNQYGSPSVWN